MSGPYCYQLTNSYDHHIYFVEDGVNKPNEVILSGILFIPSITNISKLSSAQPPNWSSTLVGCPRLSCFTHSQLSSLSRESKYR